MTSDAGGDSRAPESEQGEQVLEKVPLQIRVQIMSTEHWSLLASRALAYNEAFSRAGMFFSALSFSVVALALVGQASDFGHDFQVFALIILPVVLFLGIGTALRVDTANYNDLLCVIGMNRLRAGYLEIAPEMKRYFIMGYTDDVEGILKTLGGIPQRSLAADMFSASPVVIAVLNSVLVAAIVGLACLQLDLSQGWAMVGGVVGFLASAAVSALVSIRLLSEIQAGYQPLFPGNSSQG